MDNEFEYYVDPSALRRRKTLFTQIDEVTISLNGKDETKDLPGTAKREPERRVAKAATQEQLAFLYGKDPLVKRRPKPAEAKKQVLSAGDTAGEKGK